MNELIDQCEKVQPHSDWADLRTIDYESELPRLLEWFRTQFKVLSESEEAVGCHLYLSNPMKFLSKREQDACMLAMRSATDQFAGCKSETERNQALEQFSQVQAQMFAASHTTTDIGLGYYPGYQRSQDPDLWLDGDHSVSADAESYVLDQLYEISYRTRNPHTPVEGSHGIDTDSEWAIGLGYAILVTRSIAEATALSQFGGHPAKIAFTAGWASGDVEFVGELTTHEGFSPGQWGSSTA